MLLLVQSTLQASDMKTEQPAQEMFSRSPSGAFFFPPFFWGGFPYRKKGTLILTSLLEDLVLNSYPIRRRDL